MRALCGRIKGVCSFQQRGAGQTHGHKGALLGDGARLDSFSQTLLCDGGDSSILAIYRGITVGRTRVLTARPACDSTELNAEKRMNRPQTRKPNQILQTRPACPDKGRTLPPASTRIFQG